ncbi:MAG: N-acetylmuramoyl-L-alanine amidase [Eubacteriales bacterium]|nr:N-acetylmuramoyl-L-alanine amidase [Eubacteriales bacterium]
MRKTIGLLAVVCLLLSACSQAAYPVAGKAAQHSLSGMTIGIDPGHGDRDQGTQGRSSGVYEAELNLLVAQELCKILEDAGVNVVMTRTDDTVIYAQGEGTFKQRDMQHRSQLINESACDLMLSIHMNFFEDGQYGGAQTFYQEGSQKGPALAKAIQAAIVAGMQPDNGRKAQAKDFYMLRETNCPAVLIECGFLSNEQDEQNLQNSDYRAKLCQCIVAGLQDYLDAQ